MPVLGQILPSYWNNASILRDKKKRIASDATIFYWNLELLKLILLNLFEDGCSIHHAITGKIIAMVL
jgi:hypothetical protein